MIQRLSERFFPTPTYKALLEQDLQHALRDRLVNQHKLEALQGEQFTLDARIARLKRELAQTS